MTASTLTKLCIEHPIPMQRNGDKLKLPYHISRSRLKAERYDDHFAPAAEMALFISLYEGTLNKDYVKPVSSMLANGGEWLAAAIQANENSAIIYSKPDIAYRLDRHEAKGPLFYSPEEDIFNIAGLRRNVQLSLDEVAATDELLISRLWSRHLRDLPMEIRKNAYLIIPEDDGIHPLGRSDESLSFGIEPAVEKASRGMKVERRVIDPKHTKAYVPVYQQEHAMAAYAK